MDSSVISLSLSLFDWAKFRTTKGAIKLHAGMDDTGLSSYAVVTDDKKDNDKVAIETSFPKGSVLVADSAYVDYAWLYNLDSGGVFFVTRLKTNTDIEIAETFLTNNKHEHMLTDEQIRLTVFFLSSEVSR